MNLFRSRLAPLAALAFAAACAPPEARKEVPPAELPPFRAPAIPLIVQTPYLNVWLFGDRLADDSPKLWNGQVKGMAGMVRIDGKAYRFLGMPGSALPPMKQAAARVWPTRTEFEFLAEDVRLILEFLSPMDPRDLGSLALPLAYLRAEVSSRTGRKVQLHLDITGEWAVGSTDRRIAVDGLFRIRPSQPRLFREASGYPEWGEVHWTAVDPALSQHGVDREIRQAFVDGVPPRRDVRYPRAANDDWPVFAHAWDLGLVKAPVARRALLAHVRRETVHSPGAACPSYWTKADEDGPALVARAAAACDGLRTRALALDAEVLARARAAGGDALAALAALSFRQAFASNEIVLRRGEPLCFSKSLDLSGLSPTQSVEALYAAAPAILAFNPRLLALQLAPILDFLGRGDWQEHHAPRDLGAWPSATGQAQPDEHRLETTALLLLLVAFARQGDPTSPEAPAPVLRKLAGYLLEAAGPDRWPASDTHAVLAALLALATLPEFRAEAETRMKRWLAEADAGDHTSREFGDPSGWSLKPHVFADRLLGLGLFPEGALSREIAFARGRAGKYGPPFDGRRAIGRADATLALAALAPRRDREAFASEVLRAMNESPTRLPAGDRYETDTARIAGGQARATLGAVFAPVLLHERSARR